MKTKPQTFKTAGTLLIVLGIPGCVYGETVNHDGTAVFWTLAFFLGLIFFIIGRLGESN